MAKMLAFQFRLELITADSQSCIADCHETAIVVIYAVMSQCRPVSQQNEECDNQQARSTWLGC